MQRNKLFKITYGNDIYYCILYQTNEDILNCISDYLFKGYTLNNSTYDYIQQIQNERYLFNDFEYNIFKTLNYFDYIHSNLMRIKLCEMLYRYINNYYRKVANSTTTKFTTSCCLKLVDLQRECNELIEKETNKIKHSYNTRSNYKQKKYLESIHIAIKRFNREANDCLILIDQLHKSIWV